MKKMEVPLSQCVPQPALNCKLLGFPQLVEAVTSLSWDTEALHSFNCPPLMKNRPEWKKMAEAWAKEQLGAALERRKMLLTFWKGLLAMSRIASAVLVGAGPEGGVAY